MQGECLQDQEAGDLMWRSFASASLREEYQEQVMEKAGEAWPEEEGMEEKWKAVSWALTSIAEDLLGMAGRSQPD